MKTKVTLISIFCLVLALLVDCAPPSSLSSRIDRFAGKDRFNLLRWEADALMHEIKLALTSASASSTAVVNLYFTSPRNNSRDKMPAVGRNGKATAAVPMSQREEGQDEETLEQITERTIEQQIRAALTQQRIYNPVSSLLRINFPPVNFKLGQPPHMLIVSPRDRIANIKSIMLLPDMNTAKIESLENQVSALGVSALVVDIGGLGATFPTFVENRGDLKFTLEAVAHEWVHQYLVFKPLGFGYLLNLLGVRLDQQLVTINETVADMVGWEIGDQVYRQYYGISRDESPVAPASNTGFNFNQALRETRQQVDAFLAKGQVAEAEAYMEQRQQFLQTKGYYIRKLNQAYFAFYGSYADSPASVSPIGGELKSIRASSPSLKTFLDIVSGITSATELHNITPEN